MATIVRLIARSLMITCLLFATAGPAPQSSNTTNLPAGETPTAGMHPEVRLRKLHLVRPDLIPYPIAFEVCC